MSIDLHGVLGRVCKGEEDPSFVREFAPLTNPSYEAPPAPTQG